MIDVNSCLNSVGKKIFVDFYYDFKNLQLDKDVLAKKLLDNNPNASKISGQIIRINFARKIFDNNLEREALEIIVSSNRLDEETIRKAQEILNNDFL